MYTTVETNPRCTPSRDKWLFTTRRVLSHSLALSWKWLAPIICVSEELCEELWMLDNVKHVPPDDDMTFIIIPLLSSCILLHWLYDHILAVTIIFYLVAKLVLNISWKKETRRRALIILWYTIMKREKITGYITDKA